MEEEWKGKQDWRAQSGMFLKLTVELPLEQGRNISGRKKSFGGILRSLLILGVLTSSI
jgi:hypothetical protein